MAIDRRTNLFGRLSAMLVLAVAMGYIEAALVVYLRELTTPIRRQHFPEAVGEPVPLLTLEQLDSSGEVLPRILTVEVIREPAPLVLLAAVAWGFRRRGGDWVGFFLVGFAVWDIFYYVFLKALLGWPASLGTWDVLYLIPTAWVAPVWAPLTVSAGMLVIGMSIVLRRHRPRGAGRSVGAWLAVLCGIGMVLASFLSRTAEAFAAVPAQFDWWLFWPGWLLGLAGSARLLWPGASARR